MEGVVCYAYPMQLMWQGLHSGGMSTRKKKSTSRVRVTHNPLGMKLKSTCCRKMPRCTNCPVVYTRLLKTGALENDDVDLPRRLKEARRK